MDMCFYNSHRWSFLRILTQIIKLIFDSYMGPWLSPIEYGTAHDNYLKKQSRRKNRFFENEKEYYYVAV